MNEAFFTELCTWLTQAGLAGVPESEIWDCASVALRFLGIAVVDS
jgi:hypothetical protein